MAKNTESQSTQVAPITPEGRELMDTLGIRLSDPATFAVRIAQRLALANTSEELFAENGTSGWGERIEEPFTVRNIDWLPSSMGEGGIGFYAVVEAIDKDGSTVVLTTGATNAVIQLAKAQQMGWLDKPVKLRRSDRPTADGYYPERIVQA